MHPRTALSTRLVTLSIFAAFVAAAGAAAQGCGPDKPADAPVGTSSAATNSTAAPSASAPATAAAVPGDPAAKARMDALKASPLATPVANAGKDDMWARALVDTATWGGPGFSPDGPYYKVTLAEKGLAHVEITLKAGKCYALVGFSKLGTIVDYDLAILKTTGEKVAEDDDDDASPTIGKPPMCPTEDTIYAVEMKADKGAGDAVVQLFSKAK